MSTVHSSEMSNSHRFELLHSAHDALQKRIEEAGKDPAIPPKKYLEIEDGSGHWGANVHFQTATPEKLVVKMEVYFTYGKSSEMTMELAPDDFRVVETRLEEDGWGRDSKKVFDEFMKELG